MNNAGNVTWRKTLLENGGVTSAPSEARGNLPSIVRRMFINRSAPQPRSKKTPSGGRIMAKMILMMSLHGGSVRRSVAGEGATSRVLPCSERHGERVVVLTSDFSDC